MGGNGQDVGSRTMFRIIAVKRSTGAASVIYDHGRADRDFGGEEYWCCGRYDLRVSLERSRDNADRFVIPFVEARMLRYERKLEVSWDFMLTRETCGWND